MVYIVFYIAAFDPVDVRKYIIRVDFGKQFSAVFKTLCNGIANIIVFRTVTFHALSESVIGMYVRSKLAKISTKMYIGARCSDTFDRYCTF